MAPHTTDEPRFLRLSLGLYALVMLAMLLLAGWMRFLFPYPRQTVRVRDLNSIKHLAQRADPSALPPSSTE